MKLHKCKDSGEVYSASYLIHKEHLLHQHTAYNLSWVNCEMGSFIMMNQRADPRRNVNGSLIQSLDVLDFSVVHLSAFERLQRRWAKTIGDAKMKTGSIDPIVKATELLKDRALELRRLAHDAAQQPTSFSELNRTIAIMPFLGSDMGAGHSKLSNRLVYLQACFWSIYVAIPHVVAAVKSTKDEGFARNTSGLPFFDVLLLDNLPKVGFGFFLGVGGYKIYIEIEFVFNGYTYTVDR